MDIINPGVAINCAGTAGTKQIFFGSNETATSMY